MYALIVAIALSAAHPLATTTQLAAIQQAPARSARVDEWLNKPTPIPLSSDQRRRVDSVKTADEKAWRHMAEVLQKEGGDRTAFTMKALLLDRQLPKAIQKILTPQQRATFGANYLALEGRQP